MLVFHREAGELKKVLSLFMFFTILLSTIFMVGCSNVEDASITDVEIDSQEVTTNNSETEKTSTEKQVVEEKEYQVVASSDKEGVNIYAKKLDGLFYDFKIDYKDTTYREPFWINVTDQSRAPQIIVEDINGDETEELIVILTHGYGTGVSIQEVHVFHIEDNSPNEILVDNPMAIVFKNVKTNLLNKEAKINIVDKNMTVDFELDSEYLFNDVGFGSVIQYYVKDNQLIASIGAQISPASFIGDVVIKYEYRDKMYQAKSIEFQK